MDFQGHEVALHGAPNSQNAAALFECLHGVDQQVEDDLANLDAIDMHRWNVACDQHLDLDARPLDEACELSLDDVRQGKALASRRFDTREIQEIADNFL